MLITDIKNKDNLIPTKYLKVIKHPITGTQFFLKTKSSEEVHYVPELNGIIDYLYSNNNLWKNTSLNITEHKSRKLGALIFGVPFEKALKEVLKNGFIKSRYFLTNTVSLQNDAVISDLLVFLANNKKESQNELQIWQRMDKINEVFYIHVIIDNDSNLITHIDGATIQFTEEQKSILFQDGKKTKSISYQKHFRIDTKITLEQTIEIVKKYLPIKELTTEYFDKEMIINS